MIEHVSLVRNLEYLQGNAPLRGASFLNTRLAAPQARASDDGNATFVAAARRYQSERLSYRKRERNVG